MSQRAAALTTFLAGVPSGYRVPLTRYDDELRVIDAIALNTLPLKVACLVFHALCRGRGVPLEVVNIVLAYAMPRTVYKTPFLAPRPSRREHLHRYLELRELLEIRHRPIGGVRDWNTSFTAVCPIALSLDERFAIASPAKHQNSLGLVTERFDVAVDQLSDSEQAFCCKVGLSIEMKNLQIPISAEFDALSVHLYKPHKGHLPSRRYICLWRQPNHLVARFFLPRAFDQPHGSSGRMLPLFPAIMCFNEGSADFFPERHDVLPPRIPKDVIAPIEEAYSSVLWGAPLSLFPNPQNPAQVKKEAEQMRKEAAEEEEEKANRWFYN